MKTLLDAIQQAVEQLSAFLQWIGTLIHTRSCSKLVILAIVVIYICFAPPGWNPLNVLSEANGGLLLDILPDPLPKGYIRLFIIGELALIGVALVVTWMMRPKAGNEY